MCRVRLAFSVLQNPKNLRGGPVRCTGAVRQWRQVCRYSRAPAMGPPLSISPGFAFFRNLARTRSLFADSSFSTFASQARLSGDHQLAIVSYAPGHDRLGARVACRVGNDEIAG